MLGPVYAKALLAGLFYGEKKPVLCDVQWVANALGLAAFVEDQFCTGSGRRRT
jgi:hypothetical protein